MFTVEVIGTSGECSLLAAAVRQASQFVGVPVKLVQIDRPDQIAARKLPLTPAVVVDGVLRCQGSLPSQGELTSWLTTAALKYETA